MGTMPRRHARNQPRWRRGMRPYPYSSAQMSGRQAKTFAREYAREHARIAGAAAAADGAPPRRGAWRFRRHLVPFAWIAVLAAAAAAVRATPHPVLLSIPVAAGMAVAAMLATRHLSRFARRITAAAAAVSLAWLPGLAAAGPARPVPALLALTWAVFAAAWVRHYRHRPAGPQPAAAAVPGGLSDEAIWKKLAGRRNWIGQLGDRQDIPGGRMYPIRLDGTETHIGQIIAEPRALAAAYDRPQTEAYAEPDPSGVESRGILTILDGGTLEAVTEWDGTGFSEDGIARIARFADGAPARIRCWIPMDGTRHSLIAGASGAGKSALLDLLIWLALTSAVPVILDPQNGQSLPQWRGRVLYAAGLEECVAMERGLSAGMMDRSRRLAAMTWDDEGHQVTGMEFFDARLSGLPVVMVITDEAPYLLAGGGNAKLAAEMVRLVADRAKLGRKAGDTEQLVAQVPSLAEIGDQALRSQLVGGNVVSLRTGEKVSQGMLGLAADPSALPKYFASGEPTQGVGYVVSVDNRQAPMRCDLVPRRMRRQPAEVPQLEPEFLEAMDKAMRGALALPAGSPAQPDAADDGTLDGRRCIDAVWQVLADRGAPMERGEILRWAAELVTTGWGREKPFSIRSVGDALNTLTTDPPPGRAVTKVRDGVYQAAGQ
jgi:hypothetical protein